jgi:hypothetical protein
MGSAGDDKETVTINSSLSQLSKVLLELSGAGAGGGGGHVSYRDSKLTHVLKVGLHACMHAACMHACCLHACMHACLPACLVQLSVLLGLRSILADTARAASPLRLRCMCWRLRLAALPAAPRSCPAPACMLPACCHSAAACAPCTGRPGWQRAHNLCGLPQCQPRAPARVTQHH